jgi:hypothetical protein
MVKDAKNASGKNHGLLKISEQKWTFILISGLERNDELMLIYGILHKR